jgi:hypothetical protein
LDAESFHGFDRVRLKTIRVWLYGAKATGPIYVDISSAGSYDDRYRGKSYRFTSVALHRKFQYQGDPGKKSSIIVDGAVADEEKYAYFQPTPFSEWVISLPQQYNPNIDLTGLTKITLEFAGSVIGE